MQDMSEEDPQRREQMSGALAVLLLVDKKVISREPRFVRDQNPKVIRKVTGRKVNRVESSESDQNSDSSDAVSIGRIMTVGAATVPQTWWRLTR